MVQREGVVMFHLLCDNQLFAAACSKKRQKEEALLIMVSVSINQLIWFELEKTDETCRCALGSISTVVIYEIGAIIGDVLRWKFF